MLEDLTALETNSRHQIRDQLWCAGLEFISGLPTLEAIERCITPERFKLRDKPPGGFSYPCKLSKIKRGKLSVTEKYVKKAQRAFPGSDYYYYHSIWNLLSQPALKTNDTIKIIRNLRTKPANTLFIDVQQLADEFLLSIERKSNLDSLAAILGVCQICLKQDPNNNDLLLKVFSHMIIIFIRLSAQRPFYYISDNLYRYLKHHYFNQIKDDTKWSYQTEESYVFEAITLERFMIKIVEQLDIFKYLPYAPSSCLCIVEKHLNNSVMNKLLNRDIVTSDCSFINKESIKQWPEIKDLMTELQKWEIKQTYIQ